jgi:hypothetical protein
MCGDGLPVAYVLQLARNTTENESEKSRSAFEYQEGFHGAVLNRLAFNTIRFITNGRGEISYGVSKVWWLS